MYVFIFFPPVNDLRSRLPTILFPQKYFIRLIYKFIIELFRGYFSYFPEVSGEITANKYIPILGYFSVVVFFNQTRYGVVQNIFFKYNDLSSPEIKQFQYLIQYWLIPEMSQAKRAPTLGPGPAIFLNYCVIHNYSA